MGAQWQQINGAKRDYKARQEVIYHIILSQKNEITMQSSEACWVKHEPSVRPIGIWFLSIATANQFAGLCLLLSMIATTLKSPGYTKMDRPCTTDKSLSRWGWKITHSKTDSSKPKLTGMRKYCHGNDSEIRVAVVAPLAKSERSGGASFRKTFRSLFTCASFSLRQAKKLSMGYFFLEIAKTSQLPENKVGLQFLSSDFHSHKVDSKH